MSVRVLVADDQEIVRIGVRDFLSGAEFKIVAEAVTGAETVKLTLRHNPDLVVLDVRMPDGDGLNALGRIKLERPQLPILMFSGYESAAYFTRAIALGASGYLYKNVSKQTFIDSVRKVVAGQNIWSKDELRRVTGASLTALLTTDNESPLTAREGDILRQLALGLTNKQLTVSLQISYETVKEHLKNIFRKLGVNDRTQAAVWAVRKGIV